MTRADAPRETDQTAIDRRCMAQALVLARCGLGVTAPNPSVGAVVVSGAGDGQVVGSGYTGPGGRPHGETIALAAAGARARGATMYVTLEPCNHHGKTPPCTDAIVAAGIVRVVAPHADPDPRVAGSGFSRLRAAGIEVVTGVCEAEARFHNAGHILRTLRQRPFVQLKLAVSANGLVPCGANGAPVWVTGSEARAYAHQLRAEADAIMVGIGTILTDDPELTCRLPGLEDRSPLRVVLDRRLRLPLTSKLAATAGRHPVWVFCAEGSPAAAIQRLEALGVRVLPILAGDAEAQLACVLPRLAEHGITRLLVEGGMQVSAAFDRAQLADEYILFTGTRQLAPNQGKALTGIWAMDRLQGLAADPARRFGADTAQHFRWPDDAIRRRMEAGQNEA